MGIKKTRNRIERWFRKLKERTKRFNNNINTKTVKYVEKIAKAITLLHNITTQNRDRKGNTNLTVSDHFMEKVKLQN